MGRANEGKHKILQAYFYPRSTLGGGGGPRYEVLEWVFLAYCDEEEFVDIGRKSTGCVMKVDNTSLVYKQATYLPGLPL